MNVSTIKNEEKQLTKAMRRIKSADALAQFHPSLGKNLPNYSDAKIDIHIYDLHLGDIYIYDLADKRGTKPD